MCENCENTNHNPEVQPEFVGKSSGVNFIERKGCNPLFRLYVEDDGLWHATDTAADVAWLGDLIEVLQKAQLALSKRKGLWPNDKYYKVKKK